MGTFELVLFVFFFTLLNLTMMRIADSVEKIAKLVSKSSIVETKEKS